MSSKNNIVDLRGFRGVKSIVDAEGSIFLFVDSKFFRPLFENIIQEMDVYGSREVIVDDLIKCLEGK